MVDNNLFGNLVSQASLFGGTQDLKREAPNTLSPEATDRQSAVHALAGLRPYETGSDDELLNQYQSLIQDAQRTMETGNSEQLRQQTAARAQAEDISNYSGLARKFNTDPTIQSGVTHLLSVTLQQQAEDRARTETEVQAVRRMQEAASRGDQLQHDLIMQNIQNGDAMQVKQDIMTKQLIIQRAIEDASVSHDNQGWFRDLTDFALGIIPFRSEWVMGGVAPNLDGVVKHWYDFPFYGERLRNQAATMYGLPLDQFNDYVTNTLVPQLKRRTTLLGYHDRSLELEALRQLASTSPAWQSNTWASVDVAGSGAVGWALKGGKLTVSLIRAGAKREAEALAASNFAATIREGSQVAGKLTGITTKEALELGTPGALNGDLPGLPKSGPVPLSPAEQMAQMRATIQRGVRGLPPKAVESIGPEVKQPGLKSRLLNSASSIPEGTPLREFSLGEPHAELPLTNSEFHLSPKQELLSTTRGITAEVPLKPFQLSFENPAAAETATRQAAVRVVSDTISDMVSEASTRFVSEDEKALALENLRSQLEREFNDEAIKDVIPVVQKTTAGVVHGVQVILGDATGGGFASEALANKFMQSIGEAGAVFQGEEGQWFVRLARTLNETGLYTSGLKPLSTNGISRFLMGGRNISDEALHGLALAASNVSNKVKGYITNVYKKTLGAVNGSERNRLSAILKIGQQRAQWLNEEEFTTTYARSFGEFPRQEVIDAYKAMIEINDIEHTMLNDTMFKELSVRGFETASFETGVGRVQAENAIINRGELHAQTFARRKVMDVVTGRVYKAGEITKDELEILNGAGRKHVRLQDAKELTNGDLMQDFLVDPAEAHFSPLSRDQLPYRPGMNRIYQEGLRFVKQARSKTTKDGTTYLLNPRVTYAGTHAETGFLASKLELMRLAMKKGVSEAAFNELGEGFAGLPNYKEFTDGLKEGVYNLEHSFEAVGDRELPSTYYDEQFNNDFVDHSISGQSQYMNTRKVFYGRRGDQLLDIHGRLAPVLDPYQTMDRALNNAVATTTGSDYKISAVQRWVDKYKNYLDVAHLPSGASDYMIFRQAAIKPTVSDELRGQIMGQRMITSRILGWQTVQDLRAETFNNQVRRFLEGDNPASMRHAVFKGLNSWAQQANPIQAFNSFATHLKLGLFNIAQFPLQLSTAISATTLSPRAGMAGWALIPFVKFYVGRPIENSLQELVRRGVHKVGDFASEQEFRAFMKYANQGFMNVANSHEWAVGTSMFQSNALKKLRDSGLWFFNEAERWNRVVGMRTAWSDAMAKFAGKWESDEFRHFLNLKADDYTSNMTKVSQATWQRGVMSIPTRFWAYNARQLEAMFFGKQWSPAQKARLMMFQTLLYGAAGFPGASLVSDLIKRANGGTPGQQQGQSALDTWYGAFDRGLIDEVIYHTTGADVQFGRKQATGNFIPDLIKDLFGFSSYGEKSFAEIAGGATFSTIIDSSKTLYDVMKYMAAESGDETHPLTNESIQRLLMNASSYSNLMKGYLVQRYGIYVTNKGKVLAGVPNRDAFAVALWGSQPGETDSASASLGWLQNKTQIIKEAANQITSYRTQMAYEPDRREEIMNTMNAYVRLLDPDVRVKALKLAHGRTNEDIYHALGRQVEKGQYEEDSLNNGSH